MTELVTIYRPDGSSETLRADLARNRTYFQPDEWSLIKPPALNWDREIPRYRLSRDLEPAQKARFRSEPPFAETWVSGVWQYGERPMAAGEEIETTDWPHPSMRPLNYSAERVHAFYIGAMKSRLQVSPWHQGRVRLEDGISGPLPGHVSSPMVKPMNLRPVA
jgi:hypothetical protein